MSRTLEVLFPVDAVLVPGLKEIFELELAYREFNTLSPEALLRRSAFFAEASGTKSDLWHLCSKGTLDIKTSSTARKAFFERLAFKTGYASHGLFPYRGKFHPQLVRGLLNTMNVHDGATILDPMAGSGTTAVEANLLGMDAISCDVNPFCDYMTRIKTMTLHMTDEDLVRFDDHCSRDILEEFGKDASVAELMKGLSIDGQVTAKTISQHLFILAWTDALGYSKRRKTGEFLDLLSEVCGRYSKTLARYLEFKRELEPRIGVSEVLHEDFRSTRVPKNAADAVITSPPYSFAIDYLQEDWETLEFLGFQPEELYGRMIGLRGQRLQERLDLYFEDLTTVGSCILQSCKAGAPVCVILGNNTRQTKGVDLVRTLIPMWEKIGLSLKEVMERPITGLRNTLKTEFILFFEAS